MAISFVSGLPKEQIVQRTYNVVDLESTPNVVMLRVEIRELRKLDDEIINPLGFQSIRDGLRDEHCEHHRDGICQGISELEHDDRERHGGALHMRDQ